MKIQIIADDGQLLGTIEGIDEYNLDKPMARASVIGDIQDIIKKGQNDNS